MRTGRAPALGVLLVACTWVYSCDDMPPEAPPTPGAAHAPTPTSPPETTPPQAARLPPPVPKPEAMPHFAKKEGALQTTVLGPGDGPYRFSADWHVKHIATWTSIFAEHVGKPDLRYLEVGVYEGRSLLWMVENVMTDPSSQLVAVDIFAGDYEQTFDHNVEASGVADRITKRKGPSSQVLRDPSLGTFDIIYVDGSHTADDVLADAVLAWGLLAPGGLLVFDDYGWTGREGTPLPSELLPRMAVDLFLAAYRYEVQMVHVGYQIAVRRVTNPCQPKDYCSPLGQYTYYWRDYQLRDATGESVALTDQERGLVEALARSRPIGSFGHVIPRQIRESEAYAALCSRLGLEL